MQAFLYALHIKIEVCFNSNHALWYCNFVSSFFKRFFSKNEKKKTWIQKILRYQKEAGAIYNTLLAFSAMQYRYQRGAHKLLAGLKRRLLLWPDDGVYLFIHIFLLNYIFGTIHGTERILLYVKLEVETPAMSGLENKECTIPLSIFKCR